MPYKLVVNQLNLGDTGETYIPGLGSFANGEHIISDAQEQAYRVHHMVDNGSIDEDKKSPTFGSYTPKHELGPSLVDRNWHGITVEWVDEAPPQDDKPTVRLGTPSNPVASPSTGAPSDKENDGGES